MKISKALAIAFIHAATASFAVPLSSENLGTFFDLPEWMPSDVTSHNTPGSDTDSQYTSWYVTGEYNVETARTTAVVHFKITRDGVDVTDSVQQPTWNDRSGIWVVYNIPEDLQNDYDLNSDYYFDGYDYSKNSERFKWIGYSIAPSPYFFAEHAYVATADRIETNRYFRTCNTTSPRSFRLSPGILAAFNSTFEAYCERMYYSSCGQSNVWDQSSYGPTDIRHFDFSKGDLFHQIDVGNSYIGDIVTKNFHFVPTNRVINTRRLVDYNNFKNLFAWICNLHLNHHWMTRIFRPSWKDGSFSDVDDNDDCFKNFFHWFTKKDGGDLFSNPGFVDFDWTTNPYKTNILSKAVLTFGSIERVDSDLCDTLWSYNNSSEDPSVWYGRTSGYSLPLLWAFKNVYYLGENDPEARMPKTAISNIGFKHLLQNFFPHSKADGWNLYEPTRRRISEGLCEANQILSLMDRTYKNIDIESYGVITNRSAFGSVEQHAYVPIMLRIDTKENTVSIDNPITPENVTWSEPSTNLTISGYCKDEDADHIEYDFDAGVSYEPVEAVNINLPVYLSLAEIQRSIITHSSHPDYYEISIDANGSPMNMTIWGYYSGQDLYRQFGHNPIYPQVNSASNTLHLIAYASRSASIDETILRSVKISPFTFPGKDALPFVEDNQLFALMAIQRNETTESFCGQTYSEGDAYTARVTVPNLLMTKMKSEVDELLDGFNVSDLPSCVECNPNMLKIAREHFFFQHCGLSYRALGNLTALPMRTAVELTLNGDLSFRSGRIRNRQEVYGDFRNITASEIENGIEIGRCVISIENGDPQAGGDIEDVESLHQTAKCSFVQKIDWDWKTLVHTLKTKGEP